MTYEANPPMTAREAELEALLERAIVAGCAANDAAEAWKQTAQTTADACREAQRLCREALDLAKQYRDQLDAALAERGGV